MRIFIDDEEYVLKEPCPECEKYKHQRFEGDPELVAKLLKLEAQNKKLWERNNYLETLLHLTEKPE